MNRFLLGLATVLLLVVGGLVAWQHPDAGAAFAGACIRIGLLLGALWLALPQISRLVKNTPKWLLIASGVALVVCVIHPLYAVLALPLLAVLWFLGPKVAAFWPLGGKQAATQVKTIGPDQPAPPPRPAPPPAPRPRRRANAR